MWLQRGIDILTRINHPLVSILKYCALWTLSLMMFLTFADVLLRYIFNSPIPGAAELIQFMMGIFVSFCIVYTAHKKSHISVDLLVGSFTESIKRILACILSLVAFLLFLPMAWQAFVYMSVEFHSGLLSPVLYIPVYPFIAIVAIAFVILCLTLLVDFLGLFSEVISKWTRS
jgi:TRAP-type C4-dicarboxylate transport system permease small subunit